MTISGVNHGPFFSNQFIISKSSSGVSSATNSIEKKEENNEENKNVAFSHSFSSPNSNVKDNGTGGVSA